MSSASMARPRRPRTLAAPVLAASGPIACMRGSEGRHGVSARIRVELAACRLARRALRGGGPGGGGALAAILTRGGGRERGRAAPTRPRPRSATSASTTSASARTIRARLRRRAREHRVRGQRRGRAAGRRQRLVDRGAVRLRITARARVRQRLLLAASGGRRCDRAAATGRSTGWRPGPEQIVRRCGTPFDDLALVPPSAGRRSTSGSTCSSDRRQPRPPLRSARVPPNELGPTADFGPFPIGVRTLQLADPSRMNVQGRARGR